MGPRIRTISPLASGSLRGVSFPLDPGIEDVFVLSPNEEALAGLCFMRKSLVPPRDNDAMLGLGPRKCSSSL